MSLTQFFKNTQLFLTVVMQILTIPAQVDERHIFFVLIQIAVEWVDKFAAQIMGMRAQQYHSVIYSRSAMYTFGLNIGQIGMHQNISNLQVSCFHCYCPLFECV